MDDDADILNRLEALRGSTADILPSVGFTDAVMQLTARAGDAEDETDESLQRISRSTEEIEAHPRISDVVMERISATGSAPLEFEDIARLTQDLAPSARFTDKVMAALPKRAAKTGLSEGMMRSARTSLFAAGFAAAAAVLFSWYTERNVDADAMTSIDSFEDGE